MSSNGTPAGTVTRRVAVGSIAGLAGATLIGPSLLARLAVAAPTLAPAGQSAETTLVIAIDSDPQNLEPGTNLAWPTGSEVILNVFDTLVSWKAPEFAELEGRLAESWEISDDGITYTFHLRPNVTFHDGTPFDANAVKFSFERTKEINSYMTAYFGPIVEISADDPATVAITLEAPLAGFLSWLAMPQAAIVSPAAVEEFGDTFNVNPIGTGAFKFVSYAPNTDLVLEANPDYFRGAPAIQQIIYQVIPDASTRRLQLESGTVDIVQQIGQLSAIPAEDVAALSENPDVTVLESPSQIIRNIDFNNNKEDSPVADIRVRQALSYAVDYEALVDGLWGGTAERVYGPLTTSSWAFNPELEENPYTHDPTRARELLAEAGFDEANPLSLTMYTFQGNSWRDVGTLVQANFAEVGVTITVEQLEFPQLRELHTGGEFDIALDGRQPWFNDPDAQIGIGYLSSLAGTALNFRMPEDPDLDALIVEAQTTTDQEARKQLYFQIQSDLMAKVPGVYLFSPKLIVYTRKGIEGLLVNTAPPLSEYWSVTKTV